VRPAPPGSRVEEGAEPADPAREGPVTLHGILAYADRHAPALAVARARLERGDAEIDAASPLLPANPELRVGAGPRVHADGTRPDIEASLEQRFEIAGERGLRVEAAERFRDLTRVQLEEVRWEVHRAVHATFHAALVGKERVAAAERLLAFAERTLEIARRRLAAGEISPLQVDVAEGELAEARQAKIRADNGYLSARLTLTEISGWPVESPPEPEGSLEEPRRAPATDGLVRLALEHHPALRTRAGVVGEADARVRLEDREAWPEPALGVAYAHESDEVSTPAANIALITLSVPLPFWQLNQGGRARARADLSVARAEHDALRSTVRARVARAAAAVNASADRVAIFGTEIIPTFERNLTRLGRAFELGEIDVLELLVARGRFLELQRDALEAYDDYYRSAAELEAEVGVEVWPDRHEGPGEDRP
jgi:cobalt-zinc-cadmium efflux system outer membrane protein